MPAGPWEPSIEPIERLLTDLRPAADEVAYPLDLGGPRYVSGEWRLVFAGSPFEPLRESRFPNPQVLDRDGLVAFFASMGWKDELADGERLPLLDDVRSLLVAARYRRLWETRFYWTRLSAKGVFDEKRLPAET